MIPANADMLGWGCFLALALRRLKGNVLRFVHWRPALGRGLALLVILESPWYCNRAFGIRWMLALSMSMQAIAITYLIASLAEVRHGVVYRLLNTPFVVQMGILSYSIYVWQQLFLFPGGAKAGSDFWRRWPMNMVFVFVAAACSYYLVERPLLRFKRSSTPILRETA